MVLRIGQRVPDFSLPDTDKKERKLTEFTQKGKTVLLFFPFAFSGVCDKEMCVFRDGAARFNSLNAQPVGISVDSAFTLKVFAQTYNIQFPLLSDFNKKVSKAYGVLHEKWVAMDYKGVAKRAAFVLDGRGILRYKWVTDNPGIEPPYDEIVSALSKL
ncbi:MAG: peroxiredoxin [Nitrososphaerales archaeon]